MRKWRVRLAILLLVAGIGCLCMGFYVELEVRAEEGSGLYQGLARSLWGKLIAEYRLTVMYLMLAGPACLFLAWLVKPREPTGLTGMSGEAAVAPPATKKKAGAPIKSTKKAAKAAPKAVRKASTKKSKASKAPTKRSAATKR